LLATLPDTNINGGNVWGWTFGTDPDFSRIYFGRSLILGRLQGAIVTAGLAIGRTQKLEGGQKAGDLLTDPDDLRKRSVLGTHGFFIGVSLKFAG